MLRGTRQYRGKHQTQERKGKHQKQEEEGQKEGIVLHQDRKMMWVSTHELAGERGIVGFLSSGSTVSGRQGGPLQKVMQAGAVGGKRGEVLE